MRRRFEDEISQGGSNRIIFDITSGNPKNISGDVNGKVIQRICSKWRRCMAAPDHSVESTFLPNTYICYLDNDNSNRWWNGSTDILLDGSHGLFMVYKPRFFYRLDRYTQGKLFVDIAEQKIDPNYIESPESLIGAVSASFDGSKLMSCTGAAQKMVHSYNKLSTYLQAVGPGYQFIDWEQHCMIALMFLAKYGDRNSSNVIGIANGNYKTGYTAGIGNNDTTKNSSAPNNFLGIESVFGIGEEVIEYNTAQARPMVWNIKRPGENQFTSVNPYNDETSGYYISEMLFEKEGYYFDAVPTLDGGMKNTCYCDYYGQDSSRYPYTMITRGGSSDPGGVFHLSTSVRPQDEITLSYRLSFRGSITEVNDPEQFKALVV